MLTGLILLFFLAVLFAVGLAKIRVRWRLPMTASLLAKAIAGFAVIVLVLWVAQRR